MRTPPIRCQPPPYAVLLIQTAPAGNRPGMTLVEMLVATTCTLILMGLVGQLFGVFGNAVSGSREVMKLDAEMRSVAWRLRQDLKGVTAPTLPPLDPADGQGYFEYIDGPMRDFGLAAGQPPGGSADLTRLFGDCDDVLLFTTRSSEAPFVGKFGSGSVESDTAEVAWFLREAGGTYSLYRKQLLVVGEVGSGFFSQYGNQLPWNSVYPLISVDDLNGSGQIDLGEADIGPPGVNSPWPDFYMQYDLSAHVTVSGNLPWNAGATYIFHPNTLGKLTARENRFLHRYSLGGRVVSDVEEQPQLFPFLFPAGDHLLASAPPGLIYAGTRTGEDVVLTNVIGFDVRAFDPDARVRQDATGNALLPGDPGYLVSLREAPKDALGDISAKGAYVDLRYDDRLIATPNNQLAVQDRPVPNVPHAIGGHGASGFTVTTYSVPDPPFINTLLWSPFSDVGQQIVNVANPITTFSNPNVGANPSGVHGSVVPWPSPLNTTQLPASIAQYPLFDTWSTHYEENDFDENGTFGADEGVNGDDDDSDSFVDEGPVNLGGAVIDQTTAERGEQETAPPYPFPLRGIEIRLRCYEPRSRQVRQVTVRHTFVPH